jgi:hypothetical protein
MVSPCWAFFRRGTRVVSRNLTRAVDESLKLLVALEWCLVAGGGGWFPELEKSVVIAT